VGPRAVLDAVVKILSPRRESSPRTQIILNIEEQINIKVDIRNTSCEGVSWILLAQERV
jgi:hypothetical protein